MISEAQFKRFCRILYFASQKKTNNKPNSLSWKYFIQQAETQQCNGSLVQRRYCVKLSCWLCIARLPETTLLFCDQDKQESSGAAAQHDYQPRAPGNEHTRHTDTHFIKPWSMDPQNEHDLPLKSLTSCSRPYVPQLRRGVLFYSQTSSEATLQRAGCSLMMKVKVVFHNTFLLLSFKRGMCYKKKHTQAYSSVHLCGFFKMFFLFVTLGAFSIHQSVWENTHLTERFHSTSTSVYESIQMWLNRYVAC